MPGLWIFFKVVLASLVLASAEEPIGRQRLYPGGNDEEDLKVRESLPQATRKMDTRSLQFVVLKSLGQTGLEAPPPVDEIPTEDE